MNESIARRPLHSALLFAGAIWALTAMCGRVATASPQPTDDYLAIKQLVTVDYPTAIDSGDWKAYGALFAEDAELKAANVTTKGQKAIEENFKTKASRSRPAAAAAPAADAAADASRAQPVRKHAVSDLDIKIAGDTATSTASWQTVSILDGKTTVLYAGNYLDKLTKVNGVWKFQVREIGMKPVPGSAAAAPPAPSAR